MTSPLLIITNDQLAIKIYHCTFKYLIFWRNIIPSSTMLNSCRSAIWLGIGHGILFPGKTYWRRRNINGCKDITPDQIHCDLPVRIIKKPTASINYRRALSHCCKIWKSAIGLCVPSVYVMYTVTGYLNAKGFKLAILIIMLQNQN